MLIRRKDLDEIVAGRTDLAFRRWKRPTVKTGGTLKTAVGVLSVESVESIEEAQLTERDARRAGHASLRALLDQLAGRDGALYRIELRWIGEDPRIDLRNRASLSEEETMEIRARLARYDKASRQGPWTERTLRLIKARPETRAPDLAAEAGWDTPWFKTNVRKLKNLGLTESLGTGYRLSPRGVVFLDAAP